MRLTSWFRRLPAPTCARRDGRPRRRRRDPLDMRLYVTRLEDRRVMAADVFVDVGGTFAAAADTDVGETAGVFATTGVVGNGGAADVDFYRIEATSGSTFLAATFQPTGSADPVDTGLRLFDAAGNEVAFNDDRDPVVGDLYSQLQFTFTTTGTYYLGVSGFDNYGYDPTSGGGTVTGETGDYDLFLELDTGGTLATAFPTGLSPGPGGFTYTEFIGNGPQGPLDIDLFRLSATAGSTLLARTSLPPAGLTEADTGLRLFDAAGNELAFDDDSGPSFYSQLQFTFATAGTYYLGVSAFNNYGYDPETGAGASTSPGSSGDYELSLAWDAGQTLATATQTGVGPGLGSFCAADAVGNVADDLEDVDLFEFSAAAGSTLVAETLPIQGGTTADTVLRLFDAAGNQLAINDDYDFATDAFYSRLVYEFTAGGTYYVGVSGFANASYDPVTGVGSPAFSSSAGDYRLSLSLTQPQTLVLPQTGSVTRTGSIDAPGEVDVFRVVAAQSGLLAIRLDADFDQSGAPELLDSFLRVVRADGTRVARDDDSLSLLDSLVVVPVVAGETYFIEAAASPFVLDPLNELTDFSVGPYGLTVFVVPGPPQPVPLAGSGGQFEGTVPGTITASRGLQFFELTVPQGVVAGSVLTLDLSAPLGSNLDPYLLLFDPATGNLLDLNDDRSSGNLDSRIQTVNALAPGQSFLVVAGGFDTTFGAFSLTAQVAPITDDFGNTVPGATDRGTLAFTNGLATLGGEIELFGDQDFIRVRVPALPGSLGQRLSITAGSTDGLLDPTLELYDGNGQFLSFSDDSVNASGIFTLDSRVERIVFGGEELVLGVGAFSGSSRGAYELSFTLTSLAQTDLGTLNLAARPAGAITVGGEADLFRFVVPGTFDGALRIQQVAAAGSRLDTLLRVLDADGNEIAFNDDDGLSFNSAITIAATPGATYYVQAAAFGSSTGAYNLVFSADDAVNGLFGAEPVALIGGAGTQNGVVEIPGDGDVYQVTAAADGRMTITLTGEANTGLPQSVALADPTLAIYNADGLLVALNNDFGGTRNSRVELDVAAGQTFYVQAAGVGTSAGAYRLDVAAGAGDDVGNTFAGARRIDVTTDANGSDITTYPDQQAEIEADGDVDAFVFRADISGTATVALNLLAGSTLNARLLVFEFVDGQPVRIRSDLGASAPGTRIVTFNVTRGHDYFVQVAGNGASTGEYQLTTRTEASAADAAAVSGDAVASGLAAIRRTLASSDTLNLDATIRQLIADGLLDPTQTYLVFVTDPVDFVISEAGAQRQVGFTAGQGQVNESGTGGYSGDGVVELLILPTGGTRFNLELAGLGSDYRFDARVVAGGNIMTPTVTNADTGTPFGGPTGALLVGSNLSLALDFSMTNPGPGPGPGPGPVPGGVTGGTTPGGIANTPPGSGGLPAGGGATNAATQFFFTQIGGSDASGLGPGVLGQTSGQALAFSTEAAQAITDLLRGSSADSDGAQLGPQVLGVSIVQIVSTWQAIETQLRETVAEAVGPVTRFVPEAWRHDAGLEGEPAPDGESDGARDLFWSAVGRGLLPLSPRRLRMLGEILGGALEKVVPQDGPAQADPAGGAPAAGPAGPPLDVPEESPEGSPDDANSATIGPERIRGGMSRGDMVWAVERAEAPAL